MCQSLLFMRVEILNPKLVIFVVWFMSCQILLALLVAVLNSTLMSLCFQLLRARSILYCICRKPYDQQPMIACDECDEWYHFDCINLMTPPKIYICPACKPQIDGKTPVSRSAIEDR